MLNWKSVADELPAYGVPVLVCFEPSNPWSCEVVSREVDEFGEDDVWSGFGSTYPLSATDFWTPYNVPSIYEFSAIMKGENENDDI